MLRAMSGWSWEEGFDARQRAELARRIVAELNKRLPATTGPRLYAATGHPALSRHLERALDPVRAEGNLRKVARPGRATALVTFDPDLFARILPTVFWSGPPEVSILVFIADPSAAQSEVGPMVTDIVERTDTMVGDAVCMAFDSGDLVRITGPVGEADSQDRAVPTRPNRHA